MPLTALFHPILILLALMFVGFFLGRKGVFQKDFNKGLSFFLLKVTLPALILVSMMRDFDPDTLWDVLIILGLSLLCYLVYGLVALAFTGLLRIPQRESGVFQFSLVFSNVGFMGFPVVEALWGREFIFHTAIFNIPFHFFLFTLGVILMTRGRAEGGQFHWKLLLSPGILATVLGFGFFLLSWRPPEPVYSFLETLGGLTTPLSMVLVGSLLSQLPRRAWRGSRYLWALSFARLLVLPLLVWTILLFLPVPGELSRIAVIISAMPAAANTPLMAHEYGSHELLASQSVFFTTVLSFLSLPFLILLLNF